MLQRASFLSVTDTAPPLFVAEKLKSPLVLVVVHTLFELTWHEVITAVCLQPDPETALNVIETPEPTCAAANAPLGQQQLFGSQPPTPLTVKAKIKATARALTAMLNLRFDNLWELSTYGGRSES